MTDLQNSIKRIGLLQPLAVRPVDGGKFEVICGIRRFKALTALKSKKPVPCNVVQVEDDEAQIMSISENTARDDLTPIEEARSYAGYLKVELGDGVPVFPEKSETSTRDLGKRVGVDHAVVVKRISLLALPESIQGMVENKTLMIRPAEIIARLRQLDDRNFAEAKMKEYAMYKGSSPSIYTKLNRGRP